MASQGGTAYGPDVYVAALLSAGRLPTCGGTEGDRTPDPRVANAMLSQLSYGPGKMPA